MHSVCGNYCIFASFPVYYLGGFCQPPRLLHSQSLSFWPKFASLPVYSALPFYLKLESTHFLQTLLFFMRLPSPVCPKFLSLIFAIVNLPRLFTSSSVFFKFCFYETIKNPYFEEVFVIEFIGFVPWLPCNI